MYTGNLFNERIKQVAFIIILVLLLCLIITELRYFVSSILGAFTLYVILRTPHKKLLEKGWRNGFAVALLLIITFLVVVVVGGAFVSLLYSKLISFHPQAVLNSIRNIHDTVFEKWGYNIFSEDVIQKGVNFVGSILPDIISATGNVIANVVMMIFVLFFMLQQRVQFEKSVENFLPISNYSIGMLKKEANNMIISNVIGITLIMLGQGVFAGLAYWFTGAGDPVIWGLMTGLCGLIPVIGTTGVWLPLAINLLIGGNIWQGIFLIIYGACIISSVDNVIRMVFLKRYANVHPLVALFGVILGINLFGFWGIIFGPLVISGFLLLLKIYRREFLLK